MLDFSKGKWIYFPPISIDKPMFGINAVDGQNMTAVALVYKEQDAMLIAKAPVMYELLKDFVNPEIPADSITYQVLQTATAELLNNIDRRKDSNTGTGHSAPHLTDEEAVATNARLIACAPELYKLLKEELIPTSDYRGTLSFAREAKIRKVLDYIDGKEGD